MNPAMLIVVGGAFFASMPAASRGGLVFGTVLPMLLALAFATAASGRVSPLGLASGAMAALLGSLAFAWAPALGGALALTLVYGERALRVRSTKPARAAHLALSVLAGGAAGALVSAYEDAPLLVRGVATLMAAILASAPRLVEADDPRVLLLESAAARLGAPLSATLLDGAELLRCVDPALLDRETATNVEKSWRSLEKLVEARLSMMSGRARRGETASLVTAMVERQIAEHVASLTRAYAAVTTKGAAEASIDDTALRDVHARGEALEEQSRAIVEVGRG